MTYRVWNKRVGWGVSLAGLVLLAALGVRAGTGLLGAPETSNPCAAKTLNPCAARTLNPCAAKTLNPCAAKTLNPCAAKTLNPCAAKTLNPCAAKTLNPCLAKTLNPCAAKTLNPCVAKGGGSSKALNPCAAKAMVGAGPRNACNPCAVKNPCNPCGGAMIDPSRFVQPAGVKLALGSKADLVARGEELWNDRTLGKSGLACASCHINNYLQMQPTFAKPYPHYVAMPAQQGGVDEVNAAEMVQFCMNVPMATDPLPWDSQELAALVAWVKNIQPGYKPLGGANPCNPCTVKNPCNPCAMKTNPFNPCAVKNPCNPCSR